MNTLAAVARVRACASIVAIGLIGCGAGAAEAPASCDPSPYDRSKETDHQVENRWLCNLNAGAMPESGATPDAPGGIEDLQHKVRHVFVLMLENRSFDHYLGALGNDLPEADASAASTNPDSSGSPVPQYETSHFCLKDVSHEWTPAHVQYDNGLNDGFLAVGGKRSLAYYGPGQLPFHYFLAKTFAISDRHFSSVMGPTWPNRLFFWTGQSCGYAEDASTNPGVILDCGRAPSIFTLLGDRIDVYDDSGPAAVGSIIGVYPHFPKPMANFRAAVAAETDTTSSLPPVVMLGAVTLTFPLLKRQQDDDHAVVDVRLGQRVLFDIVQTITSNKALWESSVLFITYDENGGFYDHVPPPSACHPDANPLDDAPRFNRLGFRVPLYVVSPFAIRRHVSHYVTDHTSILRFIETWLNLPALTRRDANAWPMLDLFDFASPDYSVPVLDPAMVTSTAAELAECESNPDGFDE